MQPDTLMHHDLRHACRTQATISMYALYNVYALYARPSFRA